MYILPPAADGPGMRSSVCATAGRSSIAEDPAGSASDGGASWGGSATAMDGSNRRDKDSPRARRASGASGPRGTDMRRASYEVRRVSVTPPPSHRDRSTPRGSAGSRGSRGSRDQTQRHSLATQAYLQAQSNKKYMTRNDDELSVLRRDNAGLEEFLSNQNQFVETFTDFRINAFAQRLREAATAQRAANKFLSHVGRRLQGSPERDRGGGEDTVPESPRSREKREGDGIRDRLGPSAILEHARGKLELEPDLTREAATPSYATRLVSGAPRVRQATRNGAAKVRGLRQQIDQEDQQERERPPPPPPKDEEEEERIVARRRLQRRPLGAEVGARLPELSRQSPNVLGAMVRQPAKQRRDSTGLAGLRRRQCQKGTSLRDAAATRRKDRAIVVTGAVDYAGLLREQQALNQEVSDRDVCYERMVETYDSIQAGVHRRLSLLLKNPSLELTGSQQFRGGVNPKTSVPNIDDEYLEPYHAAPLKTHTSLYHGASMRKAAPATGNLVSLCRNMTAEVPGVWFSPKSGAAPQLACAPLLMNTGETADCGQLMVPGVDVHRTETADCRQPGEQDASPAVLPPLL